MPKTAGIDVSRWQREIDWERVAGAGYRFAVIRATIGNYYTDPRFYVNWRDARDAGLLVSAYHVVTPDRPADSQTERFFDVLDDRRCDFAPVLDAELTRGESPEDITACLEECGVSFEKADGRKPVIYTARWFWHRYVLDSLVCADFDLWVAHYGVSSPRVPRGWDEWSFWQYSDHGQVPGIHVATDLNWFNGSHEDLLAYVDGGETETEPPVAGLRARVSVEGVGVRSGPGLNYDHVGDLHEGDVVPVASLAGNDIWIQIAPERWAPFEARGKRYMELE
ncbi:MAG: GH25 family lysozyme [Chloroflexota bacterium]